jgi:hypothetical protein
MFIAVLFTIAKLFETDKMPTTKNGLRKYGIYTQGILFSHKEE